MFGKRMLLISFVLLTILAANTVRVDAEQKTIKILINGKELITDVEAMIINGRTMVPLRSVFEALDVTVDWIPETRTVIGKKDNITVVLQLDNKIASVNDIDVELDEAATAIKGRTFVPLRFIAESIQAEVEWEPHTMTVTITYEKSQNIAGSNIESSSDNIL